MMHDIPVQFTPPIKVMKLRPTAVIPRAANYGDACLDLVFAPEDGKAVWLHPGETLKLGTGLAFELPWGWEALVRSRSGLAVKNDVFVLNSPGTIDAGYRGEVVVILHMALDKGWAPNLQINPGDRIAQVCFKPVYTPLLQEVKELNLSSRGVQGLGSSGVK